MDKCAKIYTSLIGEQRRWLKRWIRKDHGNLADFSRMVGVTVTTIKRAAEGLRITSESADAIINGIVNIQQKTI